jgi:hypothetical protein
MSPEAIDQVGRDLGLSQHLLQARFVSPFHDMATPGVFP